MDSSRLSFVVDASRAWLDRHSHIVMIAAAVIFAIYFSTLGVMNHWGLRTQMNDLGHVEQALWSATQGHLSMPVSDPAFASRFVTHSNFILYLLVPLYALLPFSETLLILSALAGAGAGYLLYRLAKLILGQGWVALVFGLALLCNPLVQSLVLYDFHVDVLALPLVLGALLYLERRQAAGFWICIILLLSIKEDMPLLVLFLSPFVWRKWSLSAGMAMAAVSLSYGFIVSSATRLAFDVTLVAPTFIRFQEYGSSPGEVAFYLTTHPWIAFAAILTQKKLIYAFMIFLQGGYLAIFSPLFVLAAIPNFAQNILDQGNFQNNITFVYYSGIVITMLYAGAVYSLKKTSPRLSPILKAGLIFFPIQALVFSYLLSPAPYGQRLNWSDYTATTDPAAVERILAHIPPDAGVYTQNNLAPHLIQRQKIVEMQTFLPHADYAVFSVRIPHPRHVPLLFANTHMRLGTSPTKHGQKVQAIFDDPQFGILAFDADAALYLFKRGHNRTLNAPAEAAFQQDLAKLMFGPDGVNEGVR